MLAKFKKSRQVFEKAPPGERFERLYDARKGFDRTTGVVFTAIGGLLLAGGVVLLFIPGPGLLLIAFGAALIAQRSLRLAKILDRLELTLRNFFRKGKSFWKKASIPIRSAIVAGVGILAGAAAYVGYLWLLKN
jgi:hypothetical protein